MSNSANSANYAFEAEGFVPDILTLSKALILFR